MSLSWCVILFILSDETHLCRKNQIKFTKRKQEDDEPRHQEKHLFSLALSWSSALLCPCFFSFFIILSVYFIAFVLFSFLHSPNCVNEACLQQRSQLRVNVDMKWLFCCWQVAYLKLFHLVVLFCSRHVHDYLLFLLDAYATHMETVCAEKYI